MLDSNSEKVVHVGSNLSYLICLRHQIFSPKRPIFLHACTTCSGLPSNISSVPCVLLQLTALYLVHDVEGGNIRIDRDHVFIICQQVHDVHDGGGHPSAPLVVEFLKCDRAG